MEKMPDPQTCNSITIEVLYALPHEQVLLKLSVVHGCNVGQAIVLSGMLEKYPEIDLSCNKLGIYGKLSKTDTLLQDRDRVEIYRPLRADPKQGRRLRTQQMKQTNTRTK